MENGLIFLLVLIFPFIGGIFSYVLRSDRAAQVAIFFILIGLLFALRLFVFEETLLYRWGWVPDIQLGFFLDNTSTLLVCLVYFISFLVHLFSMFYMKEDKNRGRYFLFLGLFTSSMLGLLTSDHLVLLFIFWELVGFTSYLLIGYWFADPQKAKSAREAFMINRIADAGLLVGVIILVVVFDQQFISELENLPYSNLLQLAGLGIVIGAFGKSAQFPFYGWLPKAMAGPTPVSALIHAATMVTAGVYLLIRMVPVLTPLVMTTIAMVGAVTAFMAAFAALSQHDIKRVLAFSTISQLGYMIMGVGVGAYQASLFHLWTHAFFKAGLFLAAGVVIHFMHHADGIKSESESQDMRNMGGLFKKLPTTGLVYILCGLALSGLPLFSGFLSKEGILSGAWIWALQMSESGSLIAYIVPDLAFLAAALTPLYIGRQIMLVFFGSPRSEIKEVRFKEHPITIRLPLVLLAIGSLWFFNALNPIDAKGWWLNEFLFSLDIIQDVQGFEHIEKITFGLSVFLSIFGLCLAYYLYRPKGIRQVQYGLISNATSKPWWLQLSFENWFIEDFYNVINQGYLRITNFAAAVDKRVIDPVVNFFGISTVVFSKMLAIIDREIIDGIVNLIAGIASRFGSAFSKMQSARIQTQITWLFVFLLGLILWFQIWRLW